MWFNSWRIRFPIPLIKLDTHNQNNAWQNRIGYGMTVHYCNTKPSLRKIIEKVTVTNNCAKL
jgi:hypothetical protein